MNLKESARRLLQKGMGLVAAHTGQGFVLRGSTSLLARKIPLVLEFWPYGMKRAGSFSALTESLAGYSQFLDLESSAGRLRPIAELELLYRELGEEQAFTDILVI